MNGLTLGIAIRPVLQLLERLSPIHVAVVQPERSAACAAVEPDGSRIRGEFSEWSEPRSRTLPRTVQMALKVSF